MKNAVRDITALCRHEYIRERRNAHFSRNIIVFSLKTILWIYVSLALAHTLEAAGISIDESLPFLLLTDQVLRWFSQSTPPLDTSPYRALPVRLAHVRTAYLLRMAFTPINFIWLPAIWPQWWLTGLFMLSGYVYLACWNIFLHMCDRTTLRLSGIGLWNWSGLMSCEIKMRLRHPELRQKMRNGLLASIVLTVTSMVLDNRTYTDFATIYALTFPTLPLLTARLGYEQAYISLLRTRLHGTGAIYRTKYMASLLLLLPGVILMLLPLSLGILSPLRLLLWVTVIGLVIYPTLLACAPQGTPGTPAAQILSLATLTLPVLVAQIIQS